jgi:CBS domain containing-hemolysin-like protein
LSSLREIHRFSLVSHTITRSAAEESASLTNGAMQLDSSITASRRLTMISYGVGEAEGVWEETEADMIHKAFEFPDRPVSDVMQPRTEISFIEEGTLL